jgi:hypothetical protein
MRRQATMNLTAKDDLFAEKFVKVTFRDFTNNTRMDIKNVDLKAQQIKRDRAIAYWQNNVILNFLPPIDVKKKLEVEARKVENETYTYKKLASARKLEEELNASVRVKKSFTEDD